MATKILLLTCLVANMCHCMDFPILSSVDKGELQTIKASYMENGLITCIFMEVQRLPHNVTTYEAIQKTLWFITNYAE